MDLTALTPRDMQIIAVAITIYIVIVIVKQFKFRSND